MRILMTTDTLSGVWAYTIQLARALEPYNVQIGLATMGRPLSDDQWAELADLSNVRVYESNYRLEWMKHPEGDIRAARLWLMRIAEKFQPDVVHLNEYVYGDLDWGLPVVVTGHSCVCAWHTDVQRTTAGAEWDAYRQRVQRGLHAANVVVAASHGMLNRLENNYGGFRDAVVIAYGTTAPRYLRQQHEKQETILSAGRLWDAARNISILDDIAGLLRWPVQVAGEVCNPESGQPRQFSKVTLLGSSSSRELRQLFGNAAIYALPAFHDPFGLTALEAAFSGCALVLSRIDTLQEVWGDAPLYASPDAPEQWLAQLRRLIEEPALRTDVARRCVRHAQQYTAENMAQQYLEQYGRLLAQTSAQQTMAEVY